MPELPEVETVMRGLEPVLEGNTISGVRVNRLDLRVPFPPDLVQRLEGQKIGRLVRRAKYILIYVGGRDILVIHLGMSGSIRIVGTGDQGAPQKHDHFVMILSDKTRIIYNDSRRFGMVFLVQQDDWEQHPAFKSLGPEPLGNEFSAPILAQRLKGKKTSIKQALLDQHVVVGVGNIYACEALFMAGIHPEIPAGEVGGKKLEKLVLAIRKVLNKAIKAGGSTLKDYKHTDGSLGYFQYQFAVYDRAGQACSGCDCHLAKTGGIQKIVQSGRSTFFCPQKQKKR
ncbi:MAG: bifunctional DNA-formamidopyrimidine glycosylase/DNA-(apurinic or apyrimidinic site) lyase [Alphaproteobacteria bacterium]|nr:bifunctional DNA-formamidopyrimidine glycosylase/DNA-(apurinic or apyrimidinic site) lyase [Alphaproteobacteria bacterium]